MRQLVVVLIVLAMLSGCSYFNVTRKVTMPTGEIYAVNARKDDLVSFEKNGLKIIVDGKPAPSMMEKILMMLFMNLPDVNLEK